MNKHIHATVLTLLCSAGLVYASEPTEQKGVPRMGICQGGTFIYIQGSSRPYTVDEFLALFPQSTGNEESTHHSSSTTCPTQTGPREGDDFLRGFRIDGKKPGSSQTSQSSSSSK